MHKRPRLAEAIEVLQNLSSSIPAAQEAIDLYLEMRTNGFEFQACRMVVDIVDHHYHNMSVLEAANGS
jgi:hypothetical protein